MSKLNPSHHSMMPRPVLSILMTVLLAIPFSAFIAEVAHGQTSFPKPDRLRYDGQCLTLEGKDIFIYSGSFHYFRCPRDLWRARFEKIKEAGFNTVETYVPWNWHEREKPASLEDTSKIDLSELVDWMKMAHEEFGLYTIIRPGPFVCAEWDGGGYPRWLLSLKPKNRESKLWLRSNDPVYLAWSRHWMDAVCKVVAPEQVTRKPMGKAGVILFQLENEYNFYPVGVPVKVEHMRTLYRDALKAGIEVPMFGNLTREARSSKDPDLKHLFDAVDVYPNFDARDMAKQLINLRSQQPHAPVMLSELQGGWFSQVGGRLSEDSGLNAAQITHIALLAIEMDTTILNYYMLFGGSNFGNWFGRMGRAAASSYDYNAPIREWGGVGERYAAVKAIGMMLKDHGAVLARSKRVESKTETGSPDVTVTVREGTDGQRFLFCRNNNAKEARSGRATVGLGQFAFDYSFGPFEARILRLPPGATDPAQGEWLPKPVALPERPEVAAKSVRIPQARMLVDDTVSSWRQVKQGELLPALGVYDSRTVLYRVLPQLTANDIAQRPLLEVQVDDAGNVIVRVNGRLYTEGKRNGNKLYFDVGEALKPGNNEIILLYENTGQENVGIAINNTPGIATAQLVAPASGNGSGVSISRWAVRLLKDGELPTPFVGVDTDESGWRTFVLDEETTRNLQAAALPGAAAPADKAAGILYGMSATAVFRGGFELDEAQAKAADLSLFIPTIDDQGEVFLNGRSIGISTDWSKPFETPLQGKVKTGRNVLAIVITNKGFAGGLLKTPLLSLKQNGAMVLGLELGERLNGESRLGWTTADATGDWKSVALETSKPIARKGNGAPAGKAECLQVWYRMEFELPSPQAGVWVPWQALINASGNGSLYLNGHHLGRYWQLGPQRSYFLPECWLRFGAGQRNTLTLGLRPTTQGAVLDAVEITPYKEYAEKVTGR